MTPADACANCGKESNAVKLKNCKACHLVKYCSVDCQKTHRKQHKGACKKRVAELKDERLYGQGKERPEGDFCPICTLPIPFPMDKHSGHFVCCMKKVCDGCNFAASARNGGTIDCLFCRTPMTTDNASILAKVQTRVDAKDPEAIQFLGLQYYHGWYGLEKDLPRAIELLTEAAECGSTEARESLGQLYYRGDGVAQNQAKGIEHWEVAAMHGSARARDSLGNHECRNGNYERAFQHYSISAKMGYDNSLGTIKNMFAAGHATKQQYAQALKGYQVAVEEMKSTPRGAAATMTALNQRHRR